MPALPDEIAKPKPSNEEKVLQIVRDKYTDPKAFLESVYERLGCSNGFLSYVRIPPDFTINVVDDLLMFSMRLKETGDIRSKVAAYERFSRGLVGSIESTIRMERKKIETEINSQRGKHEKNMKELLRFEEEYNRAHSSYRGRLVGWRKLNAVRKALDSLASEKPDFGYKEYDSLYQTFNHSPKRWNIILDFMENAEKKQDLLGLGVSRERLNEMRKNITDPTGALGQITPKRGYMNTRKNVREKKALIERIKTRIQELETEINGIDYKVRKQFADKLLDRAVTLGLVPTCFTNSKN
ncbi:hypothetical protein HYT58_00425 [Candidatus Woesearchaeota archaeon]|nr:hypothetical protein [Candidatus Woesearchaeota archaeon]